MCCTRTAVHQEQYSGRTRQLLGRQRGSRSHPVIGDANPNRFLEKRSRHLLISVLLLR
jgi:hypothetical protein